MATDRTILRLYDYFRQHRTFLWVLLGIIVSALAAMASRLDYKEEISDFMPVDPEYRQAMQIYQEVAAGNRIVLIFSLTDTATIDPERITHAVEQYGELLAERDTSQWIADWQPQVDVSQVLDVFEFVYEHLPIYLTEEDYAHMDSLWQADPDFVQHRLAADYERLGSLSGSFVQPVLQHDPLGVGNRVALTLRQFQPQLQFEQYNDYIFTPDQKRCLVTITSPFGSSESQDNARLVELLEATSSSLHDEAQYADVEVCLIGSPVIAVSNASQIKHDSILAVLVSALLILALLFYAFRSSKALLQIALATGFGFLFALGILGLMRDSVSVIVIGIASVIIGIAVNYPLHLICHRQHQDEVRLTLRELVSPLLIGNVTTVGAFLTLVPLDAVAVSDLGWFSALMLVGTIIFVLLFMPHLPAPCDTTATKVNLEGEVHTFDRLAHHIIHSRVAVVVLLLLTALFGWFSLFTEFDSNLNHINYLTDRQRADMAYMTALQQGASALSDEPSTAAPVSTIFATSTSPSADASSSVMEQLHAQANRPEVCSMILSQKNPAALLPSQSTQQHRIALWQKFWQSHGYGEGLTPEFLQYADEVGFSASAFDPFTSLLTDTLEPLPYEEFELLNTTVLTGMAREGMMVAQYTVVSTDVDAVEKALTTEGCRIFDLSSLGSRVSDALSDNFNYIGLACSLIVFFFLWFSFRRIELALVAFLPMAIGWLWILGLMQLMGIQFNIVNIILATFIFGQGDDYTIFVTEGLIRDYREGRQVLVSYQRSILLSALIMLFGIGSLILAKHPAMHSLAEVTIIGMAVVVLMAWIIPPMLFNWLIKVDAPLRRYLDKQ